jgi:hypothetical protein
MEVMKRHTTFCRGLLIIFLVMLFMSMHALGQTEYYLRNGKMYIELNKKELKDPILDNFISKYNLQELDLINFIRTNKNDSLIKLGWQIELNNDERIRISKSFEAFGNENASTDRLVFDNSFRTIFPSVNNGVAYGANKFKKKFPFSVKDSIVNFFLRNHKEASRVMLAGSFNNWDPSSHPMQKTDSGWIVKVKIGAGKWWYKFIVNDDWTIDTDNELRENDGVGNINSVYYRPNVTFSTTSFRDAKKVFVAGSFNNWKPDELAMTKTANGWQLPLYLTEGTHTYKFVADGKWYSDPGNKEQLPDGNGGFNSVFRSGSSYLFRLDGFQNASKVFITGSFNGWKNDELALTQTSTGWEILYTLGAGNYEYKFIADGKSVYDASHGDKGRNFILIVKPNFTFRFRDKDAKTVTVSGDFNNWSEQGYPMKKEGDEWVLPVHLSAGKHLYKFIVDNKWIIDPANKLWEENEFGTGNSVIWVEK